MARELFFRKAEFRGSRSTGTRVGVAGGSCAAGAYNCGNEGLQRARSGSLCGGAKEKSVISAHRVVREKHASFRHAPGSRPGGGRAGAAVAHFIVALNPARVRACMQRSGSLTLAIKFP